MYCEGDRLYPEQLPGLCYSCCGRGLSSETEPHWDSMKNAEGSKFQDGSVFWQCEQVVEEESDPAAASDAGRLAAMPVEERRRLSWAASSENVLLFGIIDILARYKFKKKSQKLFTGTLLCQGKEISPQPANEYARRFQQFAREQIGAAAVLPRIKRQTSGSSEVDGAGDEARPILERGTSFMNR